MPRQTACGALRARGLPGKQERPPGLSPRAVTGVLAAGAAPSDKSVRVASVGPITAWSICYAAPAPQARIPRPHLQQPGCAPA